MAVEITPILGLPEIEPGDDLGAMLLDALGRHGVRDHDVIVVTQKIVSKAEGRLVREDDVDRSTWIERETRRVVARRGDLLIVETHHGFVCANAGVDVSNVAAGWLSLLPKDSDASAELIRGQIAGGLGLDVGVVITDTFGRPWREGLVNVAIGAAGLPSIVDLRGTRDAHGRELEATVVALADEIAAASGLVMGKADGVPVALVRGVAGSDAPHAGARALVRGASDDLFREAPLWMLRSARPSASVDVGDVPRDVLAEAAAAAAATDAPVAFVAATSGAARGRLRETLGGDPMAEASAIVLAFLLPRDASDDVARRGLLLACGAAIERFGLAIHAQGFAWAWSPAAPGRHEQVRVAAVADEGWHWLGTLPVGRTRTGAASPRPPSDPSAPLRFE
jgi:coenzyme F420-0:L-glutamate ligase/coenzyme F420-1:gamma-L-glutamate ligase